MNTRPQRLLAECVGTAALLAIVVGSGHMGATLAQGNAAIALLANSIATGLGLWVLIELFGPISGAHFNPIVTFVFAIQKELPPSDALLYVAAQFAGATAGIIVAHAMFDLPLIEAGITVRAGTGQAVSEAVATAGLVLTIFLGRRSRPAVLPAMVGAYIASAYWFTASTSFANPAVTLARSFTATFAGIRLDDVPVFMLAQIMGMIVAVLLLSRLLPPSTGASCCARS